MSAQKEAYVNIKQQFITTVEEESITQTHVADRLIDNIIEDHPNLVDPDDLREVLTEAFVEYRNEVESVEDYNNFVEENFIDEDHDENY